jgi:hypothetical protein
MIEFWIADLIVDDQKFDIPSTIGTWSFEKKQNYGDLINKMEDGQCASTFYAYNSSISQTSSDSEFSNATDDLIRICLLLSFITGKCVTPVGTTLQSDIQFIQMGDKFIRSRAIYGFPSLPLVCDMNTLFSSGVVNIFSDFTQRRMELFLSHWVSGLTCFTLEDLFLSIGVQMDIVKQCEINAVGHDLHYFQGMEEASNRFSIPKLNFDYKNMRNDIVHEGKLSAVKFSGKSKSECADVVANTLNWIDEYIAKVSKINTNFSAFSRWRTVDIENGLPALSFHV